MPRPRKRRFIHERPQPLYFKPQGIPMSLLEEVHLTPDQLEALRLAHLERLTQEEGAEKMGVSRATFGRILEQAHRKVTEAIVFGKALYVSFTGRKEKEGMSIHCEECRTTEMMADPGCRECPHCHSKRIKWIFR